MPVCCPTEAIPFFDEPVTVIHYSDAMKAEHGAEPKVSLYYIDPVTGEWYMINGIPSSSVRYDQTTSLLTVDHGGSMSGFIKIE